MTRAKASTQKENAPTAATVEALVVPTPEPLRTGNQPVKSTTHIQAGQAEARPAVKPRQARWSQKQRVATVEIEPGITCSHIANTSYFVLIGSAAALSASPRYSKYVLPKGRMMREADGIKVTRARKSDEHRIGLRCGPLTAADEYPAMADAMAARDAAMPAPSIIATGRVARLRLVSSQSETSLARCLADDDSVLVPVPLYVVGKAGPVAFTNTAATRRATSALSAGGAQ